MALAAAHALRGHFVCVFTWLIVVHDVIFCYIYRNQLKPSHVTRNGIGQPPACAYLVSTPCSSGDGGPPWWRGPGHHTPKQKMGLSKKIKIKNTEFDVQMERRFVIFSATKDQSKSEVFILRLAIKCTSTSMGTVKNTLDKNSMRPNYCEDFGPIMNQHESIHLCGI